MHDEDKTNPEAEAPTDGLSQPMNAADVLEWLGTFALFAAWVYRKGYERGRQVA